MPSVYLGCQVDDDIAATLQTLVGEISAYQKEHKDLLDSIGPDIDRLLNGTAEKASVVIGSASTNQVTWAAVDEGINGNQINITYLYLGPDVDALGNLQARPPSSYAIGGSIYIVLAVDALGNIDAAFTVATSLPIWLTDTDVAALVTGSLVGSGIGLPEQQEATPLTGGFSPTVKDAETAANEVARVFGQKTYQEFLDSIDIPVVESAEDARQYLNEGDNYRIINSKLYVVEGTNLQGINSLYQVVQKDLTKLKELLSVLAGATKQPMIVYSQNVASTAILDVCGKAQSVVTVTETYRAYNKKASVVANTYSNGDFSQLIPYIYWSQEALADAPNHKRLEFYEVPINYVGDILLGVTPDTGQRTSFQLPPPEVFTVEDPELLTKLGMTDSELVELLEEVIDGIRASSDTSIDERADALDNLVKFDQPSLANGLKTGASKAVAALQAVDLKKTMVTDDLAKELATRGSACARQPSNVSEEQLNIPNLDLPNVPSADLPNQAKKIESSYAALAASTKKATDAFSTMVESTVGVFGPLLNKVQNLQSLSENLFKNQLSDCLLGSSSAGTGIPDAPDLGSGVSPGISIPDITGGLPIPRSLLKTALESLSLSLDETVTDSFEQTMKLLSKPTCIIQAMMSSLNGFNLPTSADAAETPCKDGKDTEDSCPPEDVQAIINQSESLSGALDGMELLENLPTEPTTTTIEESIQTFSGAVEKTATETTNEISRGVKQVMDDIQKSLESQLKMVDNVFTAVNSLFNDVGGTAISAENSDPPKAGCGSASIGSFTDAISEFI